MHLQPKMYWNHGALFNRLIIQWLLWHYRTSILIWVESEKNLTKTVVVNNSWIVRRCFRKLLKRITILSTAFLLGPSNTFDSTWRKEAIWLYLVLQLLIPTIIFRNIRCLDISTAMRLLGKFLFFIHEPHPNVVHLAVHLENG